jgi:hypothetical protein
MAGLQNRRLVPVFTKPPVSTGFAGKGLFFQTVESDISSGKLEKNQIV